MKSPRRSAKLPSSIPWLANGGTLQNVYLQKGMFCNDQTHTKLSARRTRSKSARRLNILDLLAGRSSRWSRKSERIWTSFHFCEWRQLTMAIRVHLEMFKLGRIRKAQGDLRIYPPAFHDLPMEGLVLQLASTRTKLSARRTRSKSARRLNILDLLAGRSSRWSRKSERIWTSFHFCEWRQLTMAIRVHLEMFKLGRIRKAQGDLRIYPPAFHDLPMEGLVLQLASTRTKLSARRTRSKSARRLNILDLLAGRSSRG